MQQDTLLYDSLQYRPLPKWLTDQKEGLTTIQPVKIEMKEDNSLGISLLVTAVVILLAFIIATILILKKKRTYNNENDKAGF